MLPTSVVVVWDNEEQTILRFDYGPHWTWAEVNKARLRSSEMIDALPHQKPVAAIMLPPSNYIPPNIIAGARAEFLARHERIGLAGRKAGKVDMK